MSRALLATGSVILVGLAGAGAFGPWLAPEAPTALDGPVDAWTYFGPSAFYLDASLHEGQLPLWNPLIQCGVPFAANPQSKVFYPPNLLRSVLAGGPTPLKTFLSLRLYFLAHALVAAAGVYALGRRLSLSKTGAILACCAFVCGASFVLRVYSFHFVDVVAWLPWIMLFVDSAVRSQTAHTRAGFTIAAGLAMSMSMLAGYPQLFVYGHVITLVFALVQAAARRPSMPLGQRLAQGTIVFGVASVIGVIASAILIFPATELLTEAARPGSDAITAQAVPYFADGRRIANVAFEFRGAGPYSPGLTVLSVLALAATGLRFLPRGSALALAATFIVALDLAFGPPFPISTLVQGLSPISLVQSRRAFVLATLPLCLCAGAGFDALRRGNSGVVRTYVWATSLFGVGVVVSSMNRTLPDSDNEAALTTVIYTCALALAGSLGFIRTRRPRSRVAAAFLLLIIVGGEFFIWNRHYVAGLFGAAAPLFPEELEHGATKIAQENRRPAYPLSNVNMFMLRPSQTGYEPASLRSFWSVLGTDPGEIYRRRATEPLLTRDSPLGNGLLNRPFWVVPYYARGPLAGTDELVPPTLVAVCTSDTPVDVPELDTDKFSALTATLHRRRHAIRIAGSPGTGYRARIDPTVQRSSLRLGYQSSSRGRFLTEIEDESIGWVRHGWTRPIEVRRGEPGYVEIPLPDGVSGWIGIRAELTDPPALFRVTSAEIASDRWDEGASVSIVKWTANRVEVELDDLPGPRLLVFTDAMYPGWRAYIDGVESPLLEVHGAFKAIEVAAGSHHVRFEFRSRSVATGAIVSGITWATCLAALIVIGISRARSRRWAGRSR